MPSQYEADLLLVAARYRAELRDYIEQGKIPKNQLLNAMIAGDYEYVIAGVDADLARVLRVLKRHLTPEARGSDLNMAWWEAIGGTIAEEDRRMQTPGCARNGGGGRL